MRIRRWFCILVVLLLPPASWADNPTWAKKGVGFLPVCYGPEDLKRCKPQRVPSPNRKSVVEILYRQHDQGDILRAYLRVIRPDGSITVAEVEDLGYTSNDLLWAPDSKAFFVNGSHAGASEGYFVYVFRLEDPELRPIDVTRQAQRDMVKSFPPCMAAYLDKKTCASLEADPRYNMSGLDWVNGSAVIVVSAEIPGSSYYGGIMSQGVGYELEVPTGKILKRMTARDFATRWQKSMAWKFKVPAPPEYCPAARVPLTPKCD